MAWLPTLHSPAFPLRNLSDMVVRMSHMMHAAEDSLFDFLEEVTDPGSSSGSHAGRPQLVPAYEYADERQEVFYQPFAYYDDDGHHVGEDYYEDEQAPPFDAWGNPVGGSTFVAPDSGVLNPVVSFQTPNSEPLREQLYEGAASEAADLPNEIVLKDKQNFLSVVLGTQYQHTKPSGSLADEGVIRGSVFPGEDNRPQPPRDFRPAARPPPSASGHGFRFDADIDPRFRNRTKPSTGFQPSETESFSTETEWIPGNKPFRRRLKVDDGEAGGISGTGSPLMNTFLLGDYDTDGDLVAGRALGSEDRVSDPEQ